MSKNLGSEKLRSHARALRHMVLALLASTAAISSNAALAQNGQSSRTPSATYTVPAGPLGVAISRFGNGAGIQILYQADVVRGKRSGGASGPLTLEQALDRILAGTGLSYRFTAPNAVTIFDPVADAGVSVGDGNAIQLETIDVTSGGGQARNADRPYETPGSTSYVSSEQLDRVPASSTGDIFKTIPGVLAAGGRSNNTINVNIRGLQGSNRVRVLVDGTQQNTSTYRGYSGSDDRVSVDPDLISGISVEKGPSSGPYGAGAMGGVVNMQTLSVHDIVKEGQEQGVRIKGGLGTNTIAPPATYTSEQSPYSGSYSHLDPSEPRDRDDFFNGDAYNGSIAAGVTRENYDLVAAFSHRVSGNYFAGTHGPDTVKAWHWTGTYQDTALSPFSKGEEVFNTSQETTSVLAKATVRINEAHSIEFGYLRFSSEYGDVPDNYLSSHPYIPTFQEVLSSTDIDTYSAKYKWTPTDNPLIDLRANIWMSDARTDRRTTEIYSGVPSDLDFDVLTRGTEIWNTSLFDTAVGELSIRYGGEFSREEADSEEQFHPVTGGQNSWNPSGTRSIGGVFSNADLTLTDWLTISGGLRYDAFESEGGNPEFEAAFPAYPKSGKKSGDRLNPSAGVMISPWDGIQFFGKFAQGWRPPSIRETALFISGSTPTGAFLAPNPNLHPETSTNFEYGINVLRDNVVTESDKLRMKFTYFDNNYDDYIIRANGGGTTGIPAQYTWMNIDEASFNGFEISGSYDAGFVFAEASLTYYTDVEYCFGGICGSKTPQVDYGSSYVPPEYSGSVTLGTRWLDQKLVVGGRAVFAGERAAEETGGGSNATIFWKPYTVFDVFARYEIKDDISVSISAENIFDRYYVDALSYARIASPGRTIRAGLTARF